MAERTAGELAGTPGIGRSLSDRPVLVRMWVNFWRFMRTKPLSAFGVVIIMIFLVAAAAGPLVQRYDPDQVFNMENPNYDPELAQEALVDPSVRLEHPDKIEEVVTNNEAGPSWEHWFGTDPKGRDLYARVISGARLALIVGFGAALIALLLGTVFGLISAYFGGAVDMSMQRVVDSLQAFPPLVLLLLLTQVVSNVSQWTIMIAVGILGIAPVIRIVRSSVLTTRQEAYISAARTLGANDARIMFRHILPNIVAPIIVIFTISIGVYILLEATLAFIGISDSTAESWGRMVNEGRQMDPSKPWMALFAGGAITLTVLAFNLVGDGLRDALDPRMRGSGGGSGF